MADGTYQPKVYRKQGATAFVIASGGSLEIEAGGSLNLASGAITLPPNLKRGFQDLGNVHSASIEIRIPCFHTML